MHVLSVAGRKGGIGKSTIAGNLAGEFANAGQNVLVLDADPQHSIAIWAKQGKGLLIDCVRKVEEGDPQELIAQVREASRAKSGFDVVVIDTPPGLPDTAYAAAMVADLVILPCGPSPLDQFPLKEAIKLTLKARAARRARRPRVRLVPSKVTLNTTLGRNLTVQLEEFGNKLLPGICQRVVLAEAVEHGLTICEYAPASLAHQEFAELAEAVHKILRKHPD